MAFAAGGQDCGVLAATIVQKIADRAAKAARVDAVDHVPRHPTGAEEPGLFKGGKMERQTGCGQPQGLRNLARGHTCIPERHQKADEIQPGCMRQG